jgi:hypothetical protein
MDGGILNQDPKLKTAAKLNRLYDEIKPFADIAGAARARIVLFPGQAIVFLKIFIVHNKYFQLFPGHIH